MNDYYITRNHVNILNKLFLEMKLHVSKNFEDAKGIVVKGRTKKSSSSISKEFTIMEDSNEEASMTNKVRKKF